MLIRNTLLESFKTIESLRSFEGDAGDENVT